MMTYLASADLVERDESERLREHCTGQIFLTQDRVRHQGEEQLGHKGQRLDAETRGVGHSRLEMQQGVVHGEVVPMVDACDVVQVAVLDEWFAVPSIPISPSAVEREIYQERRGSRTSYT